jgi:high-affinity iron transporter
MSSETTVPVAPHAGVGRIVSRALLLCAVLAVIGVLVWQAFVVAGNPDPTAAHTGSMVAALDISVLVFREGLECILVLSAITASLSGSEEAYRRPIAAGAGVAFLATLVTWAIVVRVINGLTNSLPALDVQAATGLVAIIVLLIVMNWFFHKVYWTGWITMHNKKKKDLLSSVQQTDGQTGKTRERVLLGFGLLGFTSLYREGFEVVLFLQNYQLQMGGRIVLAGVLLGLAFTSVVAVLTFVARRRLPYKKMLVLTGMLLGVVLLVMVGEQAQEMQQAHWLPTTPLPGLVHLMPGWMGLWFSVFPTVETLVAQGVAAVLVLGSYVVARGQVLGRR